MKGIENLMASMLGVNADKMQEIMSGFIDNAAYLAKGIDEIKASISNIENRLAAMEDKIPPVASTLFDKAMTGAQERIEERQSNVESHN